MEDNSIEQINPWWNNKNFRHRVINRPFYLEQLATTPGRLIDILIGARRVGKTYILYAIINVLLEKGINPARIIYLTGELREIETSRVIDIVQNYRKKFNIKENEEYYIFIDEVQEINDWQKDVKFLYDNFNIKFFITGSSSLILNAQTSKLTGRFLLHRVFPLSFEEYLTFKKINLGNNNREKEIQVDEYLHDGGYPEYVLHKKSDYLRQVVESTLYRDLLSVYGIRNPAFLKDLLYYLADKVTTPVSAKNIQRDLKADEETAKFYLKYLQDVYLIYPLYRYGASYRITKSSNPKYYFNDTGVLYSISVNKRIGLLAENAVFLKLLKLASSKEFPAIYYYLDKNLQEIDFIDERKVLYEVKYKETLQPEEDIDPYELIGKPINYIIKDTSKVPSFNMYNLKLNRLSKFLISDEM